MKVSSSMKIMETEQQPKDSRKKNYLFILVEWPGTKFGINQPLLSTNFYLFNRYYYLLDSSQI